jgi:hypothetical protein
VVLGNASEYEEIKQNFIGKGFDEETACSQAYALMLPKIQKDLETIYLERKIFPKVQEMAFQRL